MLNDRESSEEGPRTTAAYAEAISLLIKKRDLQGRLRKVDKRLRELEASGTGVTRLAREELNQYASAKISAKTVGQF